MSSDDGQLVVIEADECRRLIATQNVGRLVLGDEMPNVRPVNFVMFGEQLVIRTAEPLPPAARVAFEVDQIEDLDRQGWSVVVSGRARAIAPETVPDELRDRLQPWAPGVKPSWTVIDIDSISGRWVRAGRTRDDDQRGYL